MSKSFTLYGTSLFLIIAAVLLIRNGFKKADFKSTMNLIHYRPIRNYGKGFSIVLGILCLILGIILLTLKPQ
jgi:hypothetical protein